MLSSKEIESVINLEANKRYQYFVKKVSDTGLVWSLYKDGWALAGDEQNTKLLPFWPTKEFASLCASGEWEGYEPHSINIHEFLDEYLDELTQNQISPAIFYTPKDKGIVPSIQKIKGDLRDELSRIE